MNQGLTEAFFQDLEDLDKEFEEEIAEKKGIDQNEIQQIKQEFKQQIQQPSGLITNEDFQKFLSKVEMFLKLKPETYTTAIETGDEEYNLLMQSNEYTNIIDREILAVHKQVRDIYMQRFPELEQLVVNAIDYVRCVQKIANETDLTKVNLSQILSSHQTVTVKVAGSSTNGKPLSNDKLEKVLLGCECVLALDDKKKKLLQYIESRMQFLAPNLTAFIGAMVGSRLIAAAGDQLGKMPACNIQVLGTQRKAILGLGKSAGIKNHLGYFYTFQLFKKGLFGMMEMVNKAPQKFQTKLVRMLSTNCAKVVRIDAARTSRAGQLQKFNNIKQKLGKLGEEIRQQMMERFSKIQEPGQSKKVKPLAVPIEKPKKRRGGKRYRKDKGYSLNKIYNNLDRLALTEIRKYKNRLAFGPDKAEKEFQNTGKGFGMLGVGTGKIKLQEKASQKIGLTKKQQKLQKKQAQFQLKGTPTDVTSGLTSSVVFTPVQGMALLNPEALRPAPKNPEQYFNKSSGFKTVVQQKKNQDQLLDNILSKNQ